MSVVRIYSTAESFFTVLKKTFAHQGCLYLTKNTVKTFITLKMVVLLYLRCI